MRWLLPVALLVDATLAHAEPISPDRVHVVDGDTITVDRGRPVRLVGFNAPEIRSHAECSAERGKGIAATRRLRELVAAGALDVSYVSCACAPASQGTSSCNYGRRCAVLRTRGKDVGAVLIAEGLAVRFNCGSKRCPPTPRPWCEGAG